MSRVVCEESENRHAYAKNDPRELTRSQTRLMLPLISLSAYNLYDILEIMIPTHCSCLDRPSVVVDSPFIYAKPSFTMAVLYGGDVLEEF